MDDIGSLGTIRSALENHGEMSRFRSQNGIRISPSPSVSAYIVCARLARIIKEYSSAKPNIPSKKINRLISKIDKLGKTELEYLYHLGTEESVSAMIETIDRPYGHICELANKWKWRDEPGNL